MNLTLRQLRYFVEVAQCQNFSKAAQRLLIAQPALSQNISRLEKELGAPLLERHARGARLTPEGERLLVTAKDLLAKVDALGETVTSRAQAPAGVVHLSVAGSVSGVIVAPVLREISARYPDVTLAIHEGLSFEIRARVESGRSDLAIMPSPSEIPGMASRSIYEEHFMIFGTPANMRDFPAALPFEQLAGLPLAVPDGAHDLRKIIERAAEARNLDLNVAYELNSAQVLIAVASEGLAYTIMPPAASIDAVKRRRITGRPIVNPDLKRVQAIVWSRHRSLSPAARAVRETIQSVAAQLIQNNVLPGRPIEAEI